MRYNKFYSGIKFQEHGSRLFQISVMLSLLPTSYLENIGNAFGKLKREIRAGSSLFDISVQENLQPLITEHMS